MSRDDAIDATAPRRPRRGPNGLQLENETTPGHHSWKTRRRDRTARLHHFFGKVVEALVVLRLARPADAPHKAKIEELLDQPLEQIGLLSISFERHFGFGPEQDRLEDHR